MSALPTPVPDTADARAIEQNLLRAAVYRAAAPSPVDATACSATNSTAANRAAVNRANAQHSTGPRTEAGKRRSSLNAIRHGLTAQTVVLPSEDPAQYEALRRQMLDEYQPATSTETQLVQELVDTAWRINRIPLLEASLLTRAENPPSDQPAATDQEPALDLVDAHRLIASLNLQGARLSRQFQKALDKLREIQEQRRHRERRDLEDAAALLELFKHKGRPWHPADHGFVFTKEQVERAADLMMRQNEARHVAYCRFQHAPQIQPGYDKHTY
jgi:hypothetical protein